MIKAAGILFISDGKALLLKRSAASPHGKEWALAGGHIEEGETPEQAARREFQEECGHTYTGDLLPIMRTNDGQVEYDTFLAVVPEQFQPKLNEEHTAYLWCALDDYPNKTMPQVKALFDSDKVRNAIISTESVRADASEVVTETDIAKQIRYKSLTSPQKFANVWLFALRISGTGLAYRAKHNEYVNRLPENYLSEEFLARCNGLPVIWIHPENDKLDSDSFAERVVGTICLPYIEGDEVWGIAKIWDETAALNMSEVQLSTSPGVVFQAGTNEKVQLSDGSHVLIEGKPSLLDHLAIVENGVWDKGGEPSGVLTEVAHVEMTEASRADSADQPDSSLKGEVKMADEIAVTPAPENEVLAILKSLAPKLEGIESRLAALEAAEVKEVQVAEAKGDEGNLPAPELNVKKDAEVVPTVAEEKPAYVADVEDMKARLDAAEKELSALKATAARADNAEEAAEFAKAQGRADAVEQAYGDAAPRPLSGDTVMGYEKRQVMKHLHRSSKWAKVDVNAIADKAAFEAIRDEVYADSIAAARACVGVPEGAVRAIKKVDGGREITQFIGKSSFVSGMGQRAM